MQEGSSSSRLIPQRVFEGRLAPYLGDGWAIACLGYAIAIGIYAVAVVFFVIPVLNGVSTGQAIYALFGRTLAIACPALITCLNLASRGRTSTDSQRSKHLFGAAITMCALMGPILAVLMLVGLVGVFTQSGPIATGIEAGLIQLAAFLIASVSTVWALSLLAPSAASAESREFELVD